MSAGTTQFGYPGPVLYISPNTMVGEEVWVYVVFIELDTKPYIPLLLSLQRVNSFGNLTFIIRLFLHETVPLS